MGLFLTIVWQIVHCFTCTQYGATKNSKKILHPLFVLCTLQSLFTWLSMLTQGALRTADLLKRFVVFGATSIYGK